MTKNGPKVPQYWELMNPTLRALRKLGGSASINEMVTEIINDLGLPDAVADVPHGDSGRTEIEYRAAWARTYLKNAGFLDNSERSVWSLTPQGLEAGEIDSKKVAREIQKLHRERRLAEQSSENDEPSAEESGSWDRELLQVLGSMDPTAFERLCQRLLRESGFTEVEVTRRSGDGGIDGHGLIRIGGLISFPVLFQSKRHAANIGPDVVRDFRGAMMGRADKGLIITTGGFTREARREATRDGAPPIDLIDGELLMEKMKDLRLGVRVTTRTVEDVIVDREWFEKV
jgi:restriction system protein